jgi:cyclopropane fatty-acyl-phospholipid synthase-like methyltransferase
MIPTRLRYRIASEIRAPESEARSRRGDAETQAANVRSRDAFDPQTLLRSQKSIAFLERADRQRWQKPDEVVTALGLRGKETIVDLGAGSGYFSFRFAKVRPRGKVVAVDTQAEMVRHIHHRAMREGIPNVEARVAAPDDPKLPAGADVVFLCDVLHHVQQRPQWLETLHTQMSSGARLVLIEFKAGKLPEGSPEAVKIPKDRLNALVREAGFRLQRDTPGLLPYQQFLTFVKP